MDPAVVAEISAQAIGSNLQALRARTPAGTQLCAAVKADAYGHGIKLVLPVLAEAGLERIAVASLQEALEARSLGWRRPILCLGLPLNGTNGRDRRERANAAVAAEIACTIATLEEAELLSAVARRLNRAARVEIKVDTGMGRMGLAPGEAFTLAAQVSKTPGLIIEGVYTHFATADEPDLAFAREQLTAFEKLAAEMTAAGLAVRHFHAANSAAIFTLPAAHFQRVRPGLSVYGYWGGAPEQRPRELRPALRVVSRINAVRRVPRGQAVGYGRTFIAERDSIVGVVPIGYGDGYRRALGNRGVVTLGPERGRARMTAAVIGRVSMDQISVDLTDVPDVRAGDCVILIDNDPAAPNCVEAVARRLETIPYEITCLLGKRVRRMLV